MIQGQQSTRFTWFLISLVSVAATVILVGVLLSGVSILLFFSAIAGVGVFSFSLLNPTGIFTYIYPLLIRVGQIPIPLGDSTISLERVLIVAGGIGIVLAMVTRRMPIPTIPRSVVIGFGLWFGMYSFSMIVYPSDAGQTRVLGYAQKAIMGYMVLAALTTPGQIKTVLKLTLISSVILSFFTVAFYFIEGDLTAIRTASFTDEDGGGLSVFEGLARVGAANTMALWIALIFWWLSKNRRQMLLRGCLVVWLGVVALFALRREILLTIPIGLAVLFLHRPIGHRRRILWMGFVLTVLIVAFILSAPEWMQRLSGETVNQLSSGGDPRLMLLLQFTPTAVAASPLLGHGPGNYAAVQLFFPDTIPPTYLLRGGLSPHNAWSAAAVEAGLIAFSGLCLFLYGLGRPLWKRRKTGDPDTDVIWAFAPIIFVQILITMVFGHAMTLPSTWFWFGFLLALERITGRMAFRYQGSR